MRQLNLREHRTEYAVPLDPSERDHLRALAKISVSPTRGTTDLYDLTPGSTVGVVQVDDLRVEIRPKVPTDRFFFLLAYSLDPDRWPDQLASFGAEPDLLESLIPGFVHQLRRALRRGVLQGYRTEEEALPVVRGRIRIDEQLRRRYGRLPPVEVRYDEFTEDIELNRTLKAAIHRLGHMRIRSLPVRRSLREFDHALERVALVEYDARRLPTFSYSRLDHHYRPAATLAQLVLRSSSLELTDGTHEARAVLVDMNTLFETFIVTALREALHLSEAEFPQNARQKALELDTRRRLRLKPDLSWWDGPRCTFVGDVKYKRVDPTEEVEHPDIYQLLAYTVATNLPGGLLVYAADEAAPVDHLIVHAHKRLRLTTVDLSGTPDMILANIQTIAEQIKDLRREALALNE